MYKLQGQGIKVLCKLLWWKRMARDLSARAKLKIMVLLAANGGKEHHWDNSPFGPLSWWFTTRKINVLCAQGRGKTEYRHSAWSPQTRPLVTDQSQMSMEDQLPCHTHSVVLKRWKRDGVEWWKEICGSLKKKKKKNSVGRIPCAISLVRHKYVSVYNRDWGKVTYIKGQTMSLIGAYHALNILNVSLRALAFLSWMITIMSTPKESWHYVSQSITPQKGMPWFAESCKEISQDPSLALQGIGFPKPELC